MTLQFGLAIIGGVFGALVMTFSRRLWKEGDRKLAVAVVLSACVIVLLIVLLVAVFAFPVED